LSLDRRHDVNQYGRLAAVCVESATPPQDGAGLRWINRFCERIVIVVPKLLASENCDETLGAFDHALRVVRACVRSNDGMPVNTKGQ
jgi:hypothetical protein